MVGRRDFCVSYSRKDRLEEGTVPGSQRFHLDQKLFSVIICRLLSTPKTQTQASDVLVPNRRITFLICLFGRHGTTHRPTISTVHHGEKWRSLFMSKKCSLNFYFTRQTRCYEGQKLNKLLINYFFDKKRSN